MIDAYEIGIELLLQDGVSAGLDVIRRELAAVDAAVAASSAGLMALTRLAEGAGGVATSAGGVSAVSGGPGVLPARAAVVPLVEDAAVLAPSVAGVDRALDVPAAPAVRREVVTGDVVAAPVQAGFMPEPERSVGAVVAAGVEATAPAARVSLELPPGRVVTAPVGPGVAAAGSGVVRVMPVEREVVGVPAVAAAPVSGAPREVTRARVGSDVRVDVGADVGAVALARAAVAPIVRSGGPVAGAVALPEGRGARAGAVDAGPGGSAPMAAAVAGRAAAPRARDRGQSEGGVGTVLLDGRLVGQWVSERMARDAARPGAGTTFFDPRQAPAWTPSGAL